MLRYLLSDGRLTESESEHIIDTFVTRLKLRNDQIPHSLNNGIRKTYNGIESDVLEDLLVYEVTKIAASINDKLVVTGINYDSGAYNLKIKLNNVEYEISTSN